MHSDIASYWSKWASVWDPMLAMVSFDTAYRQEGVSALDIESGETVLDVACGTGLNFPYLYDAVGSKGKIIAVDVAPGMLEKAKMRAQDNGFDNIEFIQGEVSDIDLPKVDAAAAFWCMVSIPDYRKALENIIASLRPHGKGAILDFKLMDGSPGPVLNPLFKSIFRLTHQDVTREPWRELRRLLENVQTHEWKYGGVLGSVYLAWGEKDK